MALKIPNSHKMYQNGYKIPNDQEMYHKSFQNIPKLAFLVLKLLIHLATLEPHGKKTATQSFDPCVCA
jgi:hypothetical protein